MIVRSNEHAIQLLAHAADIEVLKNVIAEVDRRVSYPFWLASQPLSDSGMFLGATFNVQYNPEISRT